MKIMTFNMRNDGINPFSRWRERTEGFKELIKKECPDIIGTQEMTIKSKILLDKLLKEENIYYTFYGESRKRDNSLYDEYNCILVKEGIKILNVETFSLSKTPLIPKTSFKNDIFPRIITHIETEDYHIYNTHLTPKLLKNKLLQLDCISSLIKRDKPVIVLGDFNLGMKNLKPFMNENGFSDTTKKIGNTYSTKRNLFHLDHILIDERLKYKNTLKHEFKYNGKYISDHYPVTTEIEVNNMNKYMKVAKDLADHNLTTNDGGPFGACIVKDDKIIGKGSNQVLKSNDPTAHAEIVAIREASKYLGSHDLSGCILYTSCYPCPMCLSAIIWANIKTVYYGNSAGDAANIGFRDEFIYDYIKNQDKNVLDLKCIDGEKTLETFKRYIEKEDKIIY